MELNVTYEPWPYGSTPPPSLMALEIVEQVVASVKEDANTWPKLIDVTYPPLAALLTDGWTVHQSVTGRKRWFVFEIKHKNRSVASNYAKYQEFPPTRLTCYV